MAKETLLAELLNKGKFDDARNILQRQLLSGELLDPRTDRLWAPLADSIASKIQAALGLDTTVLFWEALREFFVSSIEPVWGHAHKGHIYFRLGFAVAKRDFARSRYEFEMAYKEDSLLEAAKGGTLDEITQRSYRYSAYVALTILERIDDADFPTTSEKEQFVDQLFGRSFDVAIMGGAVRPSLVQDVLAAIATPKTLPACQALYCELQKAASLDLSFAMASLIGTVLESLLVADLYDRKSLTVLSSGKDLLRAELGPLLQEAIGRSIFRTTTVRAASQLVQIFRNRLHPGNELRQKYKLVPRVATTLKVLFELALLEWRKEFP